MNRINRRFFKNLEFNKKKKAISAIIVVILLVVIAVVLVTLLLGWGQNLATNNLDKAGNFKQEYTADTLTMFDARKFTNSKLLTKNLKSNGEVTITGYKILSDSSHPLLNKINNLPEPVSLTEGSSKFIPMVQPPEKKFDVQLITDQNKYIDIKNVYNEGEKSFAKLLRDQEGFNWGVSVIQTEDGGFGILGSTDNGLDRDILFIKLDSSGSELGTYTYDGGGNDSPYSLVTTSDGGFGILGRTHNGSDYDILFIKLDSSGSELGTYTYNGVGYDSPSSLVTTSDGGFGILGRTSNSPSWWTGAEWGNNLLLIKLDSSLSEEFVSNFGGSPSGFESDDFFKETSDGGFIFTCWSGGFGSYDDSTQWLVVKTDSQGKCPEIRSLPVNPNPGEI